VRVLGATTPRAFQIPVPLPAREGKYDGLDTTVWVPSKCGVGEQNWLRLAASWIDKRFPRARAIVRIVLYLSLLWQAFQWAGSVIDFVNHIQFFAENVKPALQAIRPILSAAISPIGSAITTALCVAFLVLDRRYGTPPPAAVTNQDSPSSENEAATIRIPSLAPDPVTDYQLEESNHDFRAVFQDLPNQSFHVVNPDKDKFSHAAWIVGFTNRRQYHCIVRARLVFKVQWRAGSPIYIHRTVVNGTWLEGTGAEVELADKETRYLILAVAKIESPAEWLSVEDHRATAHARLGIEFRSLPPASVTVEVTTTLYGGETKTFTLGANLKTLRALTDLTPAS
jgi:hypothetical protein